MLKLLVIGAATLGVIAASLGLLRAWRQHEEAARLAIRSPQGIDEAGFVTINGAPQWISIRGEDRSNPPLLLLHGGPGTSFLPIGYRALRGWERHFTVIQWDQPGAGRTFGRHGRKGAGELTLARIAADGVAVTEHARRRLGHDKVLLVGVSWGSILGLEMSRRRPDLFSAFVGAGQVVDMRRNEAVGYASLLEKVRRVGDAKAEARLLAIGPPPYPDRKTLLAERKILMAHPPASEAGMMRDVVAQLLMAPDYRLRDAYDWYAGAMFSTGKMLPDLMAYSDDVPAPNVPVPVLILQGDEDIQTPTVIAREYFDRLQAPAKRFALIPGGGHNAVLAMPDRFLEALQSNLPLLGAAPAASLLTGSDMPAR